MIAVGDADLCLAGGVESMSRAPLVMGKGTKGMLLEVEPPTTPRSMALPQPQDGSDLSSGSDGLYRRESRRRLQH